MTIFMNTSTLCQQFFLETTPPHKNCICIAMGDLHSKPRLVQGGQSMHPQKARYLRGTPCNQNMWHLPPIPREDLHQVLPLLWRLLHYIRILFKIIHLLIQLFAAPAFRKCRLRCLLADLDETFPDLYLDHNITIM